jgi:hypothetical protein
MELVGLKPAPPADRRTLLRRLSFDLTGLPPSPEELAAFDADHSVAAYDKQVDRLLGSPRFGEHWARHWMDLIRYAESHGSEGDPILPMAWRYRDYLIRAFNQDLPYDQLVREHLAGDVLSKPRRNEVEGINESLLGVAHLRMIEHGFQPVDPWEDRVKWTDNQIDVFSKAFQALTVSCVRCHDHKFDAISQKDYYALFGIFAGARPTQSAIDLPEVLHSNDAELLNLKREIQAELASAWERAAETAITGAEEKDGDSPLYPWYALREKQGEAFHAGWHEIWARWESENRARAEFNRANFRKAWDLGSPDYQAWLKRGPGMGDERAKPGEFWILPDGAKIINGIYPAGAYTNILSARHNGILQSPRFRIQSDSISVRLLGGNFSFAQLIVENYAVPRGMKIYSMRSIPKQDRMAWVRWDTSFWKGFTGHIEFATLDDVTQFALETDSKDPDAKPLRDGRSWFGAQQVCFHDNQLTPQEDVAAIGPLLTAREPQSAADLQVLYTELLRAAVASWVRGTLTGEQAAFLDFFVQKGILPTTLDKLPQLVSLVSNYRSVENSIPVPKHAPSVIEEAAPAQALLIRGNHKNPGDPVPRRYLEAIDGEPYSDARSVRLRLAEAVTKPGNPLTARVMVNRVWRYLFGAGIVRSVDNFGKLGDRPSHPELLDWLANRFVEDDWSLKKTIRRLVTSQAYRMSSVSSEEARRTDPMNRWLQHMPLKRLEAEAIRDSMLFVSGRLDLSMYGPSIPIYYAHENSRNKNDLPKGPIDGAGRRSIYLELRRNLTNPFLEVFDAPKPSTTRGERDVTNVPAQSLSLLNDPFVIDQAVTWALAVLQERESSAVGRINLMFLRALGRAPTSPELQRALELVTKERTEHSAEPSPELLAWSDLASSIFNLKEFIYLR